MNHQSQAIFILRLVSRDESKTGGMRKIKLHVLSR